MNRKIGIVAKNFIDWSGGVDLITYIANGLALNPNYHLSLLLPDSADSTQTRIEDYSSLKSTRGNFLSRLKSSTQKSNREYKKEELQDLVFALNKRVEIVYYPNSPRGFINRIEKLRLKAVIPTTLPYGSGFPVPWVGYIWDFQHKYFPEYFNEHEKIERDKIFLNTLTEAPAIIVNSQQIKKDVTKFYPDFNDYKKIIVLPFAPSLKPSWLDIDYMAVHKKYTLPERYIMVANQFWIHKDHLTVIAAMKYLASNALFKDVHLVCTGKMEEPRVASYIEKVKQAASSKELGDKVHFLGYLPKEDQLAIMKNAATVIQPTLYEGGPGGGAAYNAVALGIPLIASDIDVNKEIKADNVTLYKTGSPKDLALKIKSVLKKPWRTPIDSELLNRSRKNQQELSKALVASVEVAIKNFKHREVKL